MSRRSPRTRVLSGHHIGTVAMVAKVAAGVGAKQETGSGQVLLSQPLLQTRLECTISAIALNFDRDGAFSLAIQSSLGAIFNPKIYVADFLPFNRAF